MTTSTPINPFQVTTISDMILPTRIKNTTNLIIQSSKKTGQLPAHILLDGLSGGGKTTLANAIANEIPNVTCTKYSCGDCNEAKIESNTCQYALDKQNQCQCYESLIHCGLSTNFAQLIINLYKENVPGTTIRRIFFVDEAHALPKKLFEELLTVLEDQTYPASKNGQNFNLTLPYTTWIIATTNPEALPRPFLNRFRHRITFYPYPPDQLELIARSNAPKLNLTLDNPSYEMLTKISRSTPRTLNSLITNLKEYTTLTDDPNISYSDFLTFLDYIGIDKYGMSEAERSVIRVLGEGPTLTSLSLKNLALATGIDDVTLTSDVEPFLIREGYLKTTTAGRMLTLKGNEHYKLIRGR